MFLEQTFQPCLGAESAFIKIEPGALSQWLCLGLTMTRLCHDDSAINIISIIIIIIIKTLIC